MGHILDTKFADDIIKGCIAGHYTIWQKSLGIRIIFYKPISQEQKNTLKAYLENRYNVRVNYFLSNNKRHMYIDFSYGRFYDIVKSLYPMFHLPKPHKK